MRDDPPLAVLGGAVLPDFCGDCGGGKELTMSDLISREALGVGRCNPDVMLDPAYAAGWNGLMNIINNAPAVDAAPRIPYGFVTPGQVDK